MYAKTQFWGIFFIAGQIFWHFEGEKMPRGRGVRPTPSGRGGSNHPLWGVQTSHLIPWGVLSAQSYPETRPPSVTPESPQISPHSDPHLTLSEGIVMTGPVQVGYCRH